MTSRHAIVSPGNAASDVASVRRVLLAESEALRIMAEQQTDVVSQALDLLTVKGAGRVIVSGMGKSGHVGRKIAATMASTGTPSIYVHPAEASHGDLGMITQHDAILALSNSGETPELTDVVQYSRRFGIPLVGMTSRADSALAQAADIALILPQVDEACPMGLAPTTSTTLMLALGDALAVALLERKGFSSADFKVFHPGGKLGRKLLKVSDLMHSGDELPLVAAAMPMGQVLLVMTNKSFGCVGVLTNEGGRLAGVITDGDLRRHMEPGLFGRTAAEVMTADPKTTRAGALAAEALHVMNARSITSLFVVDENKHPVGIVHMHDCLRAGIA
ncbi:KpsF/GutQ family sugar-phosphate isomerase [Telmatospirillum siberiense]|uniref:KpsF/GutQ family sugar-phosphate isomerase n=1 Tax=Telmatospirillum siberiense TaxID=382514 RepID=A0A2N3PSP4_9PROT|nr:KpsF/GutQ family sugar-phosphate isomerase [Telmatospirillum siberiense]PKU23427.1 KpsF/GutQ family sugar-phosphate isomerase [Telmatospirillum siberiense]